jgi:hypothetical protein
MSQPAAIGALMKLHVPEILREAGHQVRLQWVLYSSLMAS